jgi:predicted SnoaL-like aldol condensation-catalyzing enzyme
MKRTMKKSILLGGLFSVLIGTQAIAQEPVTGTADESLFTDPDPKLHANKQVALHIMRELLQCNHWSDAGNWLTQKYIQHNPNAASGLAGVQAFFSSRARTPTCDKLTTPITAVLAQGDLVTVVYPRTYNHPTKPGETYTSTWFDMWRILDGKADEHWDPATIAPPAAGN